MVCLLCLEDCISDIYPCVCSWFLCKLLLFTNKHLPMYTQCPLCNERLKIFL